MNIPFYKRIWQKPPLLFPLVALFHLAMLVYSIYNYSDEPFPSVGWVQPAWIFAYALSWLFICDMKKWAAYVYIMLTITNLALRYFLKNEIDLNNYTDTLFPIDVLFTFFIMVYFKRFE